MMQLSMQELSRTCKVAEHKLNEIEYVCVHPQCQLSRFLCSKCIIGKSHIHDQKDISHILDNSDFYDLIMNNLDQVKGKQCDIQKLIHLLKNIIQEINNQLNNVQNIIQQVDQGQLKGIDLNNLEDQLLNIQKYGFNQIDDLTLNTLINLPQQQQDLDIYKQLENQSNLIIQNAIKIKEWRLSYVQNYQKSQSQKIKEAKYEIQQIGPVDKLIISAAISNDLKYIVSGQEDYLFKIWDYLTNKLVKQIQFQQQAQSCKFTDDSKFLYVGSFHFIYQFDVNNQFKELKKLFIDQAYITNIYCISNSIILTSARNSNIIKTDVKKKKQLLLIETLCYQLYGFDYNKFKNIIVCGSISIKLFNENDGSLIIEQKMYQRTIMQVLFITNNNQIISLDYGQNLIIWNINFQTKQLEWLVKIKNSGFNISLVLQQQYIITTGKNFIKVYSFKGKLMRLFDHEVDQFEIFILQDNLIQ